MLDAVCGSVVNSIVLPVFAGGTSALFMEETAADYLTHRLASGSANKKAYMDIKAFRDSEKTEFILRNYDEPSNPWSMSFP